MIEEITDIKMVITNILTEEDIKTGKEEAIVIIEMVTKIKSRDLNMKKQPGKKEVEAEVTVVRVEAIVHHLIHPLIHLLIVEVENHQV